MLWFFERGGEKIICEARLPLEGAGYELVISWPSGQQSVEKFSRMSALVRREHGLDRAWRAQGWKDLKGQIP